MIATKLLRAAGHVTSIALLLFMLLLQGSKYDWAPELIDVEDPSGDRALFSSALLAIIVLIQLLLGTTTSNKRQRVFSLIIVVIAVIARARTR